MNLNINNRTHDKFKKTICMFLLAVFISTSGGITCAAEAAKLKNKQAEEQNSDLISMNFPGAQVGYVLQSLGQLYGANFSISAAAANQVITLQFKDAKFDDILDMIKSAGNVTIREVRPRSYVVQLLNEGENKDLGEKEKELKALESRISKGKMKTFTLSYVSASDVSSALNKLLGDNAKNVCSVAVLGDDDSGGETSSSSSSSTEDEREYATIIVYAANQEIMDYITTVIKDIDIPKPMVEVEVVFVEVASNKNSDIGFDWSILPDPIEFLESSIGAVAVAEADTLTPIYRKTTIGQMRRTTGVSGTIQGNFTAGAGRGRVLSNPRIRVMSGHTAGFTSETQVPIMNKDSDGEIKTEYKNVGVNLDILPIVLENDTIYLTVSPSVSSITDTVTLGDTQAPQIASRSAQTTVLLRNGETMVIGGLLSDRDIKSMSKVPLLWKIPLFGELFKSTSITKEHSSISVYIRLKLIKDYMPDSLKVPAVNISDEAINKLLTSNSSAKTGTFEETVKIEGVLPVEIKEPVPTKEIVEIVPITTDIPAEKPVISADELQKEEISDIRPEVEPSLPLEFSKEPAEVESAPKPEIQKEPVINIQDYMY